MDPRAGRAVPARSATARPRTTIGPETRGLTPGHQPASSPLTWWADFYQAEGARRGGNVLPELTVSFPSFRDERELVPASIKLLASAPDPGPLPGSAFKTKGSFCDIRWDHYFLFKW